MPKTSETYTAKIAKNSFWGLASFIVGSCANFIISVQVTRYFGKELYGNYSYFIWFASTMSLLAGFGLSQTATKYLPLYFFRKEEQQKALRLFQKLLSLELILGAAITLFLLVFQNSLSNVVKFPVEMEKTFILIALLCIVPVSLNSLLANAISALQQFKKISLIQSAMSVLNLLVVTFFIFSKQNIISFLWLFLASNALFCLIYLYSFRNLLKPVKKELLPSKEILTYSAWNYVGNVFGQITWERSEFFFLGLYSSSSDIAIYSVAYSLALLFIGVFGPINTVLNNVTAEVVGTDQKAQVVNIFQHATKYMAMLMLPLLIYASFFMRDAVILFYGQSFSQAADFFPFLVLSHTLAIIVTPMSNMAYFKNEVRRMTFISAGVGVLNILLDFILIPRFHINGAVIANTVTQFFSIGIIILNAKKYELKFFNKEMLKVFLVNALLGLIIYLTFSSGVSFMVKIVTAIVTFILYGLLIIETGFNQNDVGILRNFVEVMPGKVKGITAWIVRRIEEKVG